MRIDLNSLNSSLDKIIPATDLKGIANIPSDLPSVDVPDVSKNLGKVSDLTSGVSEQASALQNGASEITQGVSNVNIVFHSLAFC